MKINVSSEHKKALLECQAQIAAEVQNLGPHTKTLNSARRERDQLGAEIAALEAAEDASAEAVNTLVTKRGQFELMDRKVNRLAEESGSKTALLSLILFNSSNSIHQALSPAFQDYVGDIARSFEPFYSNPADAIAPAKQTDAANQFGVFITRRYGQRDPLGEADAVLKLIASVLAGKLEWRFEPR
jgi:hypothetical protein